MASGKGLVINVKRLITYLIVIAATIYTAVLYGSTSFLMLFYVELALPVFLLLTLIPAVRHTSIRMELPIPVVEQGQKTRLYKIRKNADGYSRVCGNCNR